MTEPYEVGRYRDYETGRYRWAVLDRQTSVWYFPEEYGKRAAERLCSRLNAGVRTLNRLKAS